MKILSTILLSIILFGCGETDFEKLQSKIKSTPKGDTIPLSGTYILSHSLVDTIGHVYIGDSTATFTREDQITYVIKDSVSATSKRIVLEDVKGLMVGDKMVAVDSSTSPTNFITNISDDTVTFQYPYGKAYTPKTKMYKNINIILIPAYGYYMTYDIQCSFENISFDGNMDNNKGTYYWNFNTGLLVLNKGNTTFKKCEFRNMPNENIMGHNLFIDSCKFKDLNGSAIHLSQDRYFVPDSLIHSEITNSTFENTNQIKNDVTGHSEGCITHSNSGGYYDAKNNVFINVGESVLGSLYHSVSDHDWGTNNIDFENNDINGAGRLVWFITSFGDKIRNVKIQNNHIQNVPYRDYSNALTYNEGIILTQ